MRISSPCDCMIHEMLLKNKRRLYVIAEDICYQFLGYFVETISV